MYLVDHLPEDITEDFLINSFTDLQDEIDDPVKKFKQMLKETNQHTDQVEPSQLQQPFSLLVTVLLGKTTLTSSHQNSSSKEITTHLEPFKQSLDGPSPHLINQHHRTSRFAPQLLTPPRHPIINSAKFSQVFGKPKTTSLRPKSPCLKTNDTLCQRYRKQQHSRMADTKSVSSGTPMPHYQIISTLQSNSSRKWNIASRNNPTYTPCTKTPLTKDTFANWNLLKFLQLNGSFPNMVFIVMSKRNFAEYLTLPQKSK